MPYNNKKTGEILVMKEKEKSLLEQLEDLRGSEIPMHMPGHKRNLLLTGENGYLNKLGGFADITEIEGFDDLNDPRGFYLDLMKRAGKLWHSDEVLLTVNGSTAGILACIYGSVKSGGKVIAARNCHKSVYHALEIQRASVVYMLPEQDTENGTFGAVKKRELETLLQKNPDTELVVVTSPTYEGCVSDIRSISKICHDRSIPLLVDEAHGAHFGFGYGFPENAAAGGADLVVQSLHKTLAGFTQTAMILLNGSLINRKKVARALAIFQSSSPSFILAASMDGCIRLLEERKEDLFENWSRNLDLFYSGVKNLKNLQLLSDKNTNWVYDRSKIVVTAGQTSFSGADLKKILRERFQIQMEMAAPLYTIAMTGIGDTEETLQKLAQAVVKLDQDFEQDLEQEKTPCKEPERLPLYELPEQAMPIWEAQEMQTEDIPLESATGEVSGEYVMAYPPGIPLLVPGERISLKMLDIMQAYMDHGITLKNIREENTLKICVVKQDNT